MGFRMWLRLRLALSSEEALCYLLHPRELPKTSEVLLSVQVTQG